MNNAPLLSSRPLVPPAAAYYYLLLFPLAHLIAAVVANNNSLVIVNAATTTTTTTTITTTTKASFDKENEVKSILQRMENDALSFRDEIERVYASRCNVETLEECANANFYDCASTFSKEAECMTKEELVISACGDGVSCNALWDKKLSTISLPASLARGSRNNPNDEEVIESACYSRLAEPYMIRKYRNDEEYWSEYNVQPSWTYFGAHNGLFRKIPAIHQVTCGQYDPRRRPWFVAASSGPKDVVLIIDVSGSMDDYARLDIAKEAAITIVSTLTVADRVAIVTFSDTASTVGSFDSLVRATGENKRILVRAIGELKANGATNFYDSFRTAFDALDATIRRESTSGCNIAILFMTDGQITTGPGADEVIYLVNNRTEELAEKHGRKTTVFAFSLGLQADHAVAKSIACSTNGIWTPVDDFTGDLVSAMSSYYKLYASGLGEGGNEDFAAWVEPYPFANPAGKVGTTVSVPVYDRSVSPPLFLGVVASDMYMDAMEQVLGEDATSSTMLERFVLLSTARCPKIDLTECELDALRFLGGGEGATCGVCNATDYTGIVPEKCGLESDLPSDLWHNTEKEGKSYEERACCETSGGADPRRQLDVGFSTKSCPAVDSKSSSSKSSTGLIAGAVVALTAVFILGIFIRRRMQMNKPNDASENNNPGSSTVPPISTENFNNESTNQQQQQGNSADVEEMMKRLSSLEGITPVMPPEASAPPRSVDALEDLETAP
mmetsp:Transcript_11387/g.21552  ORF Transcript_11387/g.21552 Transcript_11387/m.21552 type:complete len:729 (+) Transcript_11387:264-2450(+)